jgi:hypothetical protein
MAKVILHSILRALKSYCTSVVDSVIARARSARAITLQCSQHRVQHYFASDNLFIIYFTKFTQRRSMISKAGILLVSSVK